MKLAMYLGLDCIDAIPLNEGRISQPGYLGSLKRELMDKHATELQCFCNEPEFLISQAGERATKKEPAILASLINRPIGHSVRAAG